MRTRTLPAAIAAALIATPVYPVEIDIRCGDVRYRLDTERNSLTDGRQTEAVDWKYDGEWIRVHLRQSDKDVAFSTTDGALVSQSTRVELGCVFENPEALAALPLSEGALLRRAFIAHPEEVRRAMQSKLADDGFYTSTVDGLWGRGTEAAVIAWARTHSLDPSREPDALQAIVALAETDLPPAPPAGPIATTPEQPVPEPIVPSSAPGTDMLLAQLSPEAAARLGESFAVYLTTFRIEGRHDPAKLDALIGFRIIAGKLVATLTAPKLRRVVDTDRLTLINWANGPQLEAAFQSVHMQLYDESPSEWVAVEFYSDISMRLSSSDGWQTYSGRSDPLNANGEILTLRGSLVRGDAGPLREWIETRPQKEIQIRSAFPAQYEAEIAASKDAIGFRDLKIGLSRAAFDVLTTGSAEVEGVKVAPGGVEPVCDTRPPNESGPARCYGLDYAFSWRFSAEGGLSELVVGAGPYSGSGSFFRDSLSNLSADNPLAAIYQQLEKKYELAYRFGDNEMNLFNLGETDALHVAFAGGQIVLSVVRPADSRVLQLFVTYYSPEAGLAALDRIRPKTAVSDF